MTAAALIGGIFGLVATGVLLDESWGFGSVMALMGVGQLVVTAHVLLGYPETAHVELETLNPEDQRPADDPPRNQPSPPTNRAT